MSLLVSNRIKKLIQYRIINNNGIYKFSNPFIGHKLNMKDNSPFITSQWNNSYILYNNINDKEENFNNIKYIDSLFNNQDEKILSKDLNIIKTEFVKLTTRLNIRNIFLSESSDTYININYGNIFILESIDSKYCYSIHNTLDIQDLRNY
jgi:hypothetical protein